MYVTSTPVIDRIVAENRVLRGEATEHPATGMLVDWIDDLRGELVELQMLVEEQIPSKLRGADVDHQLLHVANHVSQAPRLR